MHKILPRSHYDILHPAIASRSSSSSSSPRAVWRDGRSSRLGNSPCYLADVHPRSARASPRPVRVAQGLERVRSDCKNSRWNGERLGIRIDQFRAPDAFIHRRVHEYRRTRIITVRELFVERIQRTHASAQCHPRSRGSDACAGHRHRLIWR